MKFLCRFRVVMFLFIATATLCISCEHSYTHTQEIDLEIPISQPYTPEKVEAFLKNTTWKLIRNYKVNNGVETECDNNYLDDVLLFSSDVREIEIDGEIETEYIIYLA